MKVVAINKLVKAQLQFPCSKTSLYGWLQIVTNSGFRSEQDLRAAFGDIRGFDNHFKFPVPESNLLIHTLLDFKSQVVFIDLIKPGAQ